MAAGDCLEFTVIKAHPKRDAALLLLRKVHSLVKPIMKKHGWSLPRLVEFHPAQSNLLGTNTGSGMVIHIRLRHNATPDDFLDLEDLVGTMLHELTHNVRGPHDEIFFKQLAELNTEYDALVATGYSGEGFLGDGKRVGLGVSHDVDPKKAREIALAKLEERERLRRLLGTGGRLGGVVPDMKGKRRGDILADAAEARAKAIKGCGTGDGHGHLAEGEIAVGTSGQGDDTMSYRPGDAANGSVDVGQAHPGVDSIDDDSDSSIEVIAGPSKRPAARQPRPVAKVARTAGEDLPILTVGHPSLRAASKSTASSSKPSATLINSWICPSCTFDNSIQFLCCDICTAVRPSSVTATVLASEPSTGSRSRRDEGWLCHCGSVTQHDFWCCSTCGTVKQSS